MPTKKQHPTVTPVFHVSVDEQYCNIGKQTWKVSDLIFQAKDLVPFDLPLAAMDLSPTMQSFRLREFAGQVKAVIEADFSYPVILDEDGEIMDGRHRVIKAILDGKKYIKAVRFDKNPATWSGDQ